MLDEGELRTRFPEIPWDQPVKITVKAGVEVTRWCCRYCVALEGVSGQQIVSGARGWFERQEALDHIEAVHHD